MVAVQQCYKQTLVSILYLCILMIGFAYPNNTRAQSEGESWQNTSNNPACEEVRGKDTVWCGSVTDAAGNGLAAQVTINGKAMQADEKGNFLVEVPVNKELRNVVNVELLGYAPVSYIHNGSVAIQGLDIQLKTAQRFEVDPNKLIEIEDERGTRISIPESGLVDADGKRAEKPLIGYVYTYDPSKEAIPGDMDGIDFEGNLAAMYSAGAFNITIVDEQGSLYYLAPGVEAEISIRIPEGMVEPPDTMTIWELDETTGKWIARSIAKRSEDRYIGRVNFLNEAGNIDKEIPEPACVRVEIDPEYIKKYGSVLIRVEIGSPPQIRYFTLNEVVNIITNLPANTDIKFFIPHRATTPFTTVNTGAPWGGRGNPPPPYDKCNGNLAIKPPPPTPTPTPRPTLPPTPSPTPTPMLTPMIMQLDLEVIDFFFN